MITRLLYLSGLYLGDESDLFEANQYNQEGYWENSRFVFLNNRILKKFGGSWHSPPQFAPRWESDPEMLSLLEEASELVAEFQTHEIWGWKDPRNSFTLPFWKRILPDLKIIICVRNPLEVAQSLFERDGFSESKSLALWSKSYRSLFFQSEASQHIVTHYEYYHKDALSELHRLLNFIGISISDSKLEEVVTTINPNLRHSNYTLLDLDERFKAEEYLKYLYLGENESPYRNYLDHEINLQTRASVNTYLNSMVASLGLLLKRAEIEENLNAELQEQSKVDEELAEELGRQSNIGKELAEELGKQSKVGKELAEELERQSNALEELEGKIKRQGSEINMLLATIQKANQDISSLQSELAGIKGSLIWRVYKKLPRIRR
jgi:hypothetical protein